MPKSTPDTITIHFLKETYLTHLAYAAGLAERADSSHIALVPGAKLGGVVVTRRFQGDARVHVSGLQVVVLTEQTEMKRNTHTV